MRLVLAACLALTAAPLSAQDVPSDDRAILEAREDLLAGSAQEAVAVLEPAARAGNPRAQFLYGSVFEYGDLGTVDAREAIRWYEMAADQGNPWAMYRLGILFRYGIEGVEIDHVRARAEFERALPMDFGPALAELGLMLREGLGGPVDVELATLYLDLGADLGDSDASTILGYSYEHGIGVAEDLTEARRLYQVSALQGNYVGQNNFAWLAANGWGGPQDLDLAAEYLRKSMTQGYDLAGLNLAYLLVDHPELDPQPLASAAHCVWAMDYATVQDQPGQPMNCSNLLEGLTPLELKQADKLAQALVAAP